MLSNDEMLNVYNELLKSSELTHIEAKKASGGIGDSVMQTVCAFANEPNTNHGYLLLGVSEPNEDHDKHWVSGVEDTDKILNDLQNNCRNQFENTIQIEANILILENKKVVVAKVFELNAASKPCGFKSSGKKSKNYTKTGVWRRGINGDYEARIDELQDIIAAKAGQSFENVVLPNASLLDIDSNAIALYRKQRAKVQADAAELEYSDNELLLSFNLIQEVNGVLKPNVAGLLLFGSHLALRRHLPMARVDYIRNAGTRWVEDSDERFMYTKDFREPLIEMIPRIEAIIMDDMPNHFRLDDNELQRSDEPLLPQRVVREALVNMVMHRDYSANQPSQINRFKDRLEMQNAGYSLKPLDSLDSASSVTRNPLIAAVLYDLRLAETKGSGIRTMRDKLNQAKLSAPRFDSNHVRNYFKATFLLHQLMDDKQLKWLEAFDNYGLSDNDAMALMLAYETGKVNNSSLRDITKLDTLSASSLLSKLCKKNLLQKKGKGTSTIYTLTEYALDIGLNANNDSNFVLGDITSEADVQTSEADVQTSDADVQTSEADVQTSDADVQTSDADVQTSDADVQTSDADDQYAFDFSESLKLEEPPRQALNQLQALPKKSLPEEVDRRILILCQNEALSTDQLSKNLNRNSDYLRKQYISQLLNRGLIRQLYADSPKHPYQAYITTELGEEWINGKTQ